MPRLDAALKGGATPQTRLRCFAVYRLRGRLDSAFFGGGGDESSPLLFELGAAALGAFCFAFIVIGDGLSDVEFFVAGGAKVFVLRHGGLLGEVQRGSVVRGGGRMQWEERCRARMGKRRWKAEGYYGEAHWSGGGHGVPFPYEEDSDASPNAWRQDAGSKPGKGRSGAAPLQRGKAKRRV